MPLHRQRRRCASSSHRTDIIEQRAGSLGPNRTHDHGTRRSRQQQKSGSLLRPERSDGQQDRHAYRGSDEPTQIRDVSRSPAPAPGTQSHTPQKEKPRATPPPRHTEQSAASGFIRLIRIPSSRNSRDAANRTGHQDAGMSSRKYNYRNR
jgi:hypothetical protein